MELDGLPSTVMLWPFDPKTESVCLQAQVHMWPEFWWN